MFFCSCEVVVFKDLAQRKILREKLIEVLQLKINLIEVENQKDYEMTKENYERMADVREEQKELHRHIILCVEELGEMNNVKNAENQRLLTRIVQESKFSQY